MAREFENGATISMYHEKNNTEILERIIAIQISPASISLAGLICHFTNVIPVATPF